MYDENVDGYSKDVFNLLLQDRDTIYIGMNYYGCCYYGCLISNEKMKFFKLDTTYRIEITRHQLNSETTVYFMPAKPFEKVFGKYIADVKQSFYKPMKTDSSGKITIVVSHPAAYSENVYVRKGDTIYKFPKGSGWFEYNTFKAFIEDTRQKAIGEEANREMGIQNDKWGTILVKQKNN